MSKSEFAAATDKRQLKPHVAIVRRVVPQRLWANFNAAAQFLRLTVVEVKPENSRPIGDADPKVLGFNFVKYSDATPGAIHSLLDSISPDVVLVFGWSDYCGFAMMTWAKRHGRPIIMTTDTNAFDYDRSYTREFIKRQILSDIDLAWAAGSSASEYLVRLGVDKERIVVGPLDTVDVDHFGEGAAAARINAAEQRRFLHLPERYFLSVSRLAPEKNIDGLLRAYSAYRDRCSDEAWKLVILGDGPERSALESLIEELGLGDFVQMPGFASFERIPAYYGLASAFVLASTREPWAVVVNEAAASGLPIIVSNRAGSSRHLVIDDVNGFIINPLDHSSITNRLHVLSHGNRDLMQMGNESRRLVASYRPNDYGRTLGMLARRSLELQPRPFRLIGRICVRGMLSYLGAH